MKSDTERKKFYTEKLHKRKNRLHVHLSKDLRSKMKTKKRSLLLRKNDKVKIMRGPEKGKEAKVVKINTKDLTVLLEGVVVKTIRGKEVPIPVKSSNLLLVGLDSTPERSELFSSDVFKAEKTPKAETAKPEAKKEVKN
jgi:large subunit ribosomal protein L26e